MSFDHSAANREFCHTGDGDLFTRTHFLLQNNKRPCKPTALVTNLDPGPDGQPSTADDPGTTVTYFEYPGSLAGAAFQEAMLINHPPSEGTYKSFELAASKRLSNRWMFTASYSATRLNVPVVPNTAGLTDFTSGGGLTVILATFDPNAEIFATNNTWEWLGRVTGGYLFPADVLVSANFEHRSGDPWARQVSVTGGKTITVNRQRVEDIGARRLPNLNVLSLRLEKSFASRRHRSWRCR